jgi:hypothetical protein
MPSLRFLHDSWWLKSEIMDYMESVKIYDQSIYEIESNLVQSASAPKQTSWNVYVVVMATH